SGPGQRAGGPGAGGRRAARPRRLHRTETRGDARRLPPRLPPGRPPAPTAALLDRGEERDAGRRRHRPLSRQPERAGAPARRDARAPRRRRRAGGAAVRRAARRLPARRTGRRHRSRLRARAARGGGRRRRAARPRRARDAARAHGGRHAAGGDVSAAAAATATRRLRAALLAWYRRHRRDLPWRRTRDPWAIWISEAMLQQTRVETVIPYWQRFLARFPDPAALADAELDEVLRLWSGLGYYSRAR